MTHTEFPARPYVTYYVVMTERGLARSVYVPAGEVLKSQYISGPFDNARDAEEAAFLYNEPNDEAPMTNAERYGDC